MTQIIKRWFKKTKTEMNKRCIIYCNCGNILNDGVSAIKKSEDAIYEYNCYQCNEISVFHFALAPVPIKI